MRVVRNGILIYTTDVLCDRRALYIHSFFPSVLVENDRVVDVIELPRESENLLVKQFRAQRSVLHRWPFSQIRDFQERLVVRLVCSLLSDKVHFLVVLVDAQPSLRVGRKS